MGLEERVAQALSVEALGRGCADWDAELAAALARVVLEELAPDLKRMETARKAFVTLTEGWAGLRMDTEKDQELHDRLVEISRGAANLVPSWVGVTDQ